MKPRKMLYPWTTFQAWYWPEVRTDPPKKLIVRGMPTMTPEIRNSAMPKATFFLPTSLVPRMFSIAASVLSLCDGGEAERRGRLRLEVPLGVIPAFAGARRGADATV